MTQKFNPCTEWNFCAFLGTNTEKREKTAVKKAHDGGAKVHTKNRAEFETNALSEVYFHNSYVHFLSDKKDPKENKRIQEETEDVLQVSRSTVGEHPERAASLLYARMFKKRENKMR